MKKHLPLLSGVLVDALVFGDTAAYASGILAERSTCNFYLNGSPVEIEAYMIGGKATGAAQ